MDFPQYRKLKNELSYYRIEDENRFTEIQVVGKRKMKFEIYATQYPEKLKILDMINCEFPYFKIDQGEFDEWFNNSDIMF